MVDNRRKVKSYVLMDGQMHNFESLDDALALAGGELSEELAALLDEQSTFFIVENADADDMPPELARGFDKAPLAHKHLCAIAGIAYAHTFSVRHPILAVDAGAHVVMIVTQAHKIETFIKKRYRQTIPLKSPPSNKRGRWAVTIAPDESCARTTVVLEPRSGIGRA